MRKPTVDEAEQFAVMLNVGVPPSEALLYFLSDEEKQDPTFVSDLLRIWTSSRLVGKEVAKLQGGAWEELSLDERIRVALDKNYAEKAFFLYSNNFSEVSGQVYTKLQEARKVLEAKVAGTSGKMNALDQFLEDVRTGRKKLGQTPPPLPLPEIVN